jgi:hypothetical protein
MHAPALRALKISGECAGAVVSGIARNPAIRLDTLVVRWSGASASELVAELMAPAVRELKTIDVFARDGDATTADFLRLADTTRFPRLSSLFVNVQLADAEAIVDAALALPEAHPLTHFTLGMGGAKSWTALTEKLASRFQPAMD